MALYTILCLDTSGSMAGKGLQELKNACEVFIARVKEIGLNEHIGFCFLNLFRREYD